MMDLVYVLYVYTQLYEISWAMYQSDEKVGRRYNWYWNRNQCNIEASWWCKIESSYRWNFAPSNIGTTCTVTDVSQYMQL